MIKTRQRELFHHSAQETVAQKPTIPICLAPPTPTNLEFPIRFSFVSSFSTLIKRKGKVAPTAAPNIPINVMNMHDGARICRRVMMAERDKAATSEFSR